MLRKAGKSASQEGVWEGFSLFYQHCYVKCIFTISNLHMVQVAVLDYLLKFTAKMRYDRMYPDDPLAALKSLTPLMGVFGMCTNGLIYDDTDSNQMIFTVIIYNFIRLYNQQMCASV